MYLMYFPSFEQRLKHEILIWQLFDLKALLTIKNPAQY